MSEISRDMNGSAETNTGRDLFRYYIRGVAEMLSGDDFSPSSSANGRLVRGTNGGFRVKEDGGCDEKTSRVGFGSLFCNAAGDGLSVFEKERLVALLRQCVVALTREVDEMLDPVIALHRLRGLMAPTKGCVRYQDADYKIENENRAQKRLKVPSSSSSVNEPLIVSPVSCSPTEEVNDDLQVLLVNRGPKVAEKMEKHSAELSATLGRMQENLEELLDVVISSCRPMMLAEKLQLRRSIEKLPPQNLDRVVEIIQRKQRSENQSSHQITVDLQHEDDLTLWRIYFYVKAVENARKLLV